MQLVPYVRVKWATLVGRTLGERIVELDLDGMSFSGDGSTSENILGAVMMADLLTLDLKDAVAVTLFLKEHFRVDVGGLGDQDMALVVEAFVGAVGCEV